MDQILSSFGLREKTAAGLSIIFSLSYMHQAPRHVQHTCIKCYQNYYPKLRKNTGVGVLIDQILTMPIIVPGLELILQVRTHMCLYIILRYRVTSE
jgi:hypothetical protein